MSAAQADSNAACRAWMLSTVCVRAHGCVWARLGAQHWVWAGAGVCVCAGMCGWACVCVRACVRACVRVGARARVCVGVCVWVCVCGVCVWGGGQYT